MACSQRCAEQAVVRATARLTSATGVAADSCTHGSIMHSTATEFVAHATSTRVRRRCFEACETTWAMAARGKGITA